MGGMTVNRRAFIISAIAEAAITLLRELARLNFVESLIAEVA
jgi:hypothetical protein